MIIKSLISDILAYRCLICNRRTNSYNLCEWCKPKNRLIPHNTCPICQSSNEYNNKICTLCINYKPNFNKLDYLWDYNIQSMNLIKLFKYQNHEKLLNYTINESINFLSYKNFIKDNFDIIIAMPESYKTAYRRNYNPCALLAKKIGKKFKIQYKPSILIKNNKKQAQAKLKGIERIKNIKGAIKVKKKSVTNKNILLIDDVITTGASLNETLKVLKDNKAKSISVFSIARSPNWHSFRGTLKT